MLSTPTPDPSEARVSARSIGTTWCGANCWLVFVAYLWLVQFSARGMSEARWASDVTALAYGAGFALTLHEFALWLRLTDVYSTRAGRASVDAVMSARCSPSGFWDVGSSWRSSDGLQDVRTPPTVVFQNTGTPGLGGGLRRPGARHDGLGREFTEFPAATSHEPTSVEAAAPPLETIRRDFRPLRQ